MSIYYGSGLFFKNSEDLTKAIEVLKKVNISCVDETCYVATINTEIQEQIGDDDDTSYTVSDVIGVLEGYDEVWESLEQCVNNAIYELD